MEAEQSFVTSCSISSISSSSSTGSSSASVVIFSIYTPAKVELYSSSDYYSITSISNVNLKLFDPKSSLTIRLNS